MGLDWIKPVLGVSNIAMLKHACLSYRGQLYNLNLARTHAYVANLDMVYSNKRITKALRTRRLDCTFFVRKPPRVSRVEADLTDSKFVHLYYTVYAQGYYLRFSLDYREDMKKTYNSICLLIYNSCSTYAISYKR